MIATLTGILKAKTPTEVLIDVNGVGYAVSVPISTFEKLGNVEERVVLYTYLVVREDAMQLFGFATMEERELFKLLISINGIGPRTAQGILSGVTVTNLIHYIAHENIAALTSLPNVGRKTAERLIVELRDKVAKLPSVAASPLPSAQQEEVRNQALLALNSLGFSRATAEKALRGVLNETKGQSLSLEELIRRALRQMSSA